jgi:hypothetical protein
VISEAEQPRPLHFDARVDADQLLRKTLVLIACNGRDH